MKYSTPKISPFSGFAAIALAVVCATGCANRSESETQGFAEVDPIVGLSFSEPTPEEVAAAREETTTFTLGETTEPTADPDQKGDERLKFCHSAKWSATCLYGLMVYRCGQYAFPFTPYGCAAASASFMGVLDLRRIDVTFEDGTGHSQVYSLPVVFVTKLEKMIGDPKVQGEIRELKRHLEVSATSRTAFDLWSWAYGISNAKSDRAIEWLSVLLQDTSPVQIQVEYLRILEKEGRLSNDASRALDDLMMVADFLTPENLQEVKWKEWLRLYPSTKNLEEDTTPLIYHFYPMAYLAQKLKRMHGARLASFLPFLFNTEYLNQEIDPEMWPLKHPRSEKVDLKLPSIRWKMRDLYGGYAGGLFGVGKISTSPGLSTVQDTYSKAPFKTMQRLFWTMP
jgi:hypothetical protein